MDISVILHVPLLQFKLIVAILANFFIWIIFISNGSDLGPKLKERKVKKILFLYNE